MSDLIDQLTSEHQEISMVLMEVNKLGINTHDGQMKLMLAKNLLFNHLQKENEELFPILNLEAKYHKNLKTNMQVVSLEMKGILEKIVKFFHKHGKGHSNGDFNLDFAEVLALLVHHFAKEEKVLYVEYERVKNSAKIVSLR